MRVIALCLVLILPSCGVFGGGGNPVGLPVTEASEIANLVSVNLPLFDYDRNGILSRDEAVAFGTWFAAQLLVKYALPSVGEPMNPSLMIPPEGN